MSTKNDATPIYRRIVKDAWRVAWVHKHLWIFGIFATFLGFGGVTETVFGIFDQISGAQTDSVHFGTLGIMNGIVSIPYVVDLAPYPTITVVLYLTMLLAVIGVLAFVVSIAIGGLVHGIRKVERGGEPTVKEGIKAGKERAIDVFSANLLSKAIVALAFILTSANLFSVLRDGSFTSGFFYLGSYVVFTAIALMAAVTGIFATMDVVTEKAHFAKAWPRAWHLVKDNWLVTLEMVFLLTLVNLVVMVLALLAAMLVSIPLIFLFLVAALAKSQAIMALMIAVTAAALVILIVLIGAFMTTFQASCWYFTWKELTGKRPVPHIVRIVNEYKARRR